MITSRPFLSEIPLRPITLAHQPRFRIRGLALGTGVSALEVVIADHDGQPAMTTLRSAWKERNGGRAAPLLFVALYGDKCALCGPAGEDPPAYLDLDPGQAERICREALEQSDRNTALRTLRDSLPSVESALAGVRNEGYLALHELRAGAQLRQDWESARAKAQPILALRGEPLLRGLGFTIDPCDRVTSILRAGDRKLGLAVLLQRDESPDIQTTRFSNLSPITYALSVADRENLEYVVIQHGAKIRIYPTRVGTGVGRRGRTETYVECHAGLLRDADAAYLWLLCSAEALTHGGSLSQFLDASSRFSGDLAERLRKRIYQSVVPLLATGIAKARRLRKPTAASLAETYEMTMTVLFRLLFIAYAEDKDLLPYRLNGLYKQRSLKTKAQEILTLVQANTTFDEGDSLWEEVGRLFRAVDVGNREWSVPAYNGELFSSELEVSRVGALLANISLPNTIFGPALRDLLLVESSDGLGPVDFRSLSVSEFGTIYEGLLESELSVAESDLVVDKEGVYRPAKARETPLVSEGEIYLHNSSGARKASGAYFTKHFAVEHLLERTLDPAIAEHLARLDKLDDDDAAERFFDFRIADIAMGSGHFLIEAVDHIERRFSNYIAQRPLPGVVSELRTLQAAAAAALGPIAEQIELEDTQLLRRLIARRCVYGVDINPISVQLARLAIWIHTFVPGLPLSLMDHNLVCGNSLVGIATLSELNDYLREYGLPLLMLDAGAMLGDAREHLAKLARITDATRADLQKARKALADGHTAVAPAAALFDIVTGCRITGDTFRIDVTDWAKQKKTIVDSPDHRRARKGMGDLEPFHFPIAFPEVFLREREGFDVIVGNPPWQEATLEEDAFWARHSPGLRSMPQREQEAEKKKLRKARPDLFAVYEQELAEADAMRRALVASPFPGMGTGDPDLYKAFCWRFWHLVVEDGGRVGVVLPRSALAAKGSSEFRIEVFSRATSVDLTMLLNTRGWVFDDAEHRYTIGLVAVNRRPATSTAVSLRGPFASMERYLAGIKAEPAVFTGDQVREWNDTASLPLLPTDESLGIFLRLRKSPRLDLNKPGEWRARPHAELHATNDKKLMDLKSEECPKGFWPVYKGESFDIWSPDTGTYYAWADPEKVTPVLQDKRWRGRNRDNSVFGEFDPATLGDSKTLPCARARIAFRDITNRTNTRTVVVALVPPKVFITNKGPYLLWPRGDERDQAYLLGILSSLSLDWYARRFVEVSLNFFIFNPFPVPRPAIDSPLRKRVIELAGRLASPDKRFAAWAKAVGVECGPLKPEEKDDMIQELDAVVAHLYALTEKQLVHIFETFHENWDHGARLAATLKHFREWRTRA